MWGAPQTLVASGPAIAPDGMYAVGDIDLKSSAYENPEQLVVVFSAASGQVLPNYSGAVFLLHNGSLGLDDTPWNFAIGVQITEARHRMGGLELARLGVSGLLTVEVRGDGVSGLDAGWSLSVVSRSRGLV